MSFLDIQLPPHYSYGCQFGLNYTTLVMGVPSRAEQRIRQASRAYRSATITFDDYSIEQMQVLRDFFIGVGGKQSGFRAKDWFDFKADQEVIQVVSTAGVYSAQLRRTYQRFGQPEIRPITKPQTSLTPVVLTKNGTLYDTANYSLDVNTGRVLFNSNPGSGTFRWSGHFDTPVRFDFDEMMATLTDFNIMTWDSIKIMEIPVNYAP